MRRRTTATLLAVGALGVAGCGATSTLPASPVVVAAVPTGPAAAAPAAEVVQHVAVRAAVPRATPTLARRPAAPAPLAPRVAAPVTPAVPHLSLTAEAEQVLFVGTQFGDASAPSYVSAGAGGVWFLGEPAAGQGPAIAAANARIVAAGTTVRPFVATDEEGGEVARLANVISPQLPSQRTQAATWTPAQLTSVVAQHARAMAGLGFSLDFAPVVDTAPANDTIGAEGSRSFSADPATASTYGIASFTGWKDGGILPVLKHFPGLGHANADTDQGPATDPPLSQLEGHDLVPFQRGVYAGAPAVMMSHAIVPGLTNGQPTSMAPAAYTYLRSTFGFRGLAMTDSLSAGAISAAHYTQASASVQALVAGADLVLVDHSQQAAAVSAIVSAVQSGHLSQARLDDAVAAVLRAKGVAAFVDPHACTVGATESPGRVACAPARTLHR